jgi:hypothetical protein
MPAGAAAYRFVSLLVSQKGSTSKWLLGLNGVFRSRRLTRGDVRFARWYGLGGVTSSDAALARQGLRAEVRRVATAIRKVEETLPGFFGEDAAIIRRQAASDDVLPEVLQQTLSRLKLAFMPVWLGHEFGLEVDGGCNVEEAWKRMRARFFRT